MQRPYHESSEEGTTDTPLIFSEQRSLQHCNNNKNGTLVNTSKDEKLLKFLMEYYNMSEKERLKFGIKPSKFLKECSFNGRHCFQTHLTNTNNLRYGNCITF
ncbi:hypothetical protein CEXT_257281 [Caerostris extrusa]|uniref:Uncharacterized protein n=1 Tax=Caerostris extrusa TaxID=172846 RepID=A0AAV4RLS1_CAEEX|nr:hypothetical protein CEXT_257281 [Caerostris extrusa]